MRRVALTLLLFAAVAYAQALPPLTVTGEIPAWHPAYSYWTVSQSPLAIACYRNGLRQISGVDFTISGKIISSHVWQSTDKLVCDYSYAGNQLVTGSGLISAALNNSIQLSVDTSYIAYRTATVPLGPGVCTVGTGVWATDSSYLYFCVPNATNDGFIWARVQLVTSWTITTQ